MDCGKCNTEHTYRLEKLDNKVEELEKCSHEMKIKLEKVDESTKSAHLRLNEIGEQTLAIYKLGVAVENMAEQFKEFTTSFKEHEDRIDKLEREPADNAYKLLKTIGGYVLAILIAYGLGKWGIK